VGERDHIAGRFDGQMIVQVRDAEIMDDIAVVVPKSNDGGGRVNREVKIQAGLRRTGDRLQAHLVERLVNRAGVGIGGTVGERKSHGITSSGCRMRGAKYCAWICSPI